MTLSRWATGEEKLKLLPLFNAVSGHRDKFLSANRMSGRTKSGRGIVSTASG